MKNPYAIMFLLGIGINAVLATSVSLCTHSKQNEFTVKLDKPTHLVVEAPEYFWLTSDGKPCQAWIGDCTYKNAGSYSYSWAEPGGDTCMDEKSLCVCRVKYPQEQ